MIRTLKIERFKSIVKLELELGRVNVFIGANGSGKSNLLEAVGILGAAAFGRVDDETPCAAAFARVCRNSTNPPSRPRTKCRDSSLAPRLRRALLLRGRLVEPDRDSGTCLAIYDRATGAGPGRHGDDTRHEDR